jgi:hypothetical protein
MQEIMFVLPPPLNLSPRVNIEPQKYDTENIHDFFQMVGRAHRGQNERIPPPPPPTLQELMAQQNEIL